VRASLVRLAGHVATLRGRIEAAGIERTFFVCSTPRTGSTMLGNLLADSGLVGRAGEYFGEVFRREVVPRLSRRRFDDYLVDCTQHARGTGTLGIKLHWDQIEVFLYLLRLRRGLRGLNDRQVIEAVFPAPRFVWMTRRDTLAQAVSWWKAMTSGKWTDGRPVTGEPTFDVDGIAGRVQRIDEHAEAWRRWFERNGVEPLRLTYEELVADPTCTARRVLSFVGVDVPSDLAVDPGTERQADAVNEEWMRRYRELLKGEPARPVS
jgi:LPS sulfotransferase NodH